MRRGLWRCVLVGALAALAAAPPAFAEVKTEVFRVGPIQVNGYQVKQGGNLIPKPSVDGFVTGMDVDVVDENDRQVPISRLMLHHIVFLNSGTNFDRRDGTCNQFTGLDSRTRISAAAERFYAAGEERAVLGLPRGYGYFTKGSDRWVMTWMLMNHRQTSDRAYVRYRVTYDTSPNLTHVKPYWLDVRNCLSDPVFDVPGGGRRGSTFRESTTWTVPESGRIVAGGGHVHGGAKNLVISQPRCGDRALFASRPLWGGPRHPFYNVKPILHEPGPVNMSGFLSGQGFRVARGDRIKLTANYDGELLHTRVMGIMVVYMAPDASVRPGCAPRPRDLRVFQPTFPGARREPPRFTVPLTGIDRNGRARAIDRPPGRTRRLPSGAVIDARDFFFNRPNVSVAQGSLLRWRFGAPGSSTLHDVTVANGPRGFSAPHLNDAREFRQRLKVPGTYRYFCSLHPVEMTGTVTVRSARR